MVQSEYDTSNIRSEGGQKPTCMKYPLPRLRQRPLPPPLFGAKYGIFTRNYIEVDTHKGTGLCNKSRGQVSACELAIFATKSSREQFTLVPKIQTSLNSWD